MTRKAYYITFASVTLAVFVIMACLNLSSTSAIADDITGMGFAVIGRCSRNFDIVYDLETGVIYTMSTHPDNIGSMTLMVNPDGTPRVYEGFGGK